MNDTHSDESSVVALTTIVGSFMLFMICFALRTCSMYNYIDNTNQIRSPSEECEECSPPIYVVDSPPTYQESLPLPSYTELNSHTQELTHQELHEHRG
jgi:hypothetical protein